MKNTMISLIKLLVFFEGIENLDLEYLKNEIPEEWLRKQFEKSLTKEQKDKIKSLGDLED